MKVLMLRQLISEKVRLLAEASEYGFDLTEFKSGGFQRVLKGLGISVAPGKFVASSDDPKYGNWEWQGSGIRIVTGNDPITGKYAKPLGGRKDEKDYASYMGIEGDTDKVKLAVKLIKQNAEYIKGTASSREFI